MSVGEIVSALKSSCEFFLNFFLPHELKYSVPEFHKTTWQYLTSASVPLMALALPRGHAKTTLAKLAVVWYFLFTPFRFIIYVSNTHSIACESCRDIMNYIRSDNFVSVFGAVQFDVMQDQKGFYKFKMHYMDAAGNLKEKYCILKALGAGQQIRGMNIDNTRPQLGVCDDLEDQDNTATPILIKKLSQWFFGAFFKAFAIDFKLIYIGNMLSNRSLLYDFCEKAQDWFSLRYGCVLADGKPLWSDMWPLEKIRLDYESYKRRNLLPLWFAEMMNMPVAEGNLLIESDDIPYSPNIVPGEQRTAFITIDPAISEKTWADDRAIVVHAMHPISGHWQIADHIVGKFPPDVMFWLVVELAQKWSTRCVGIEQAGYQMALRYLFETLGVIHNQHFDIVEIPHKNKSKVERLAVWCSLLRKRAWALNEGDFAVTEQLLAFDPMKKTNIDDLIDACSMGVTMVDLYLPSIMDSFTVMPVKDQYRVKSGREVARI